ncbi:MAG: hypothetical protein A3C36_07495 [Omnitrophica WOR_2 bacterium RIFCSPHIGHO2_02_FULL_52_10]|nr:MAG: hypothetical protein A3C36_07495 [Omnitrophica WOR_2 bacterium RIFCSPHIGHO2_02_FULL_52_10]
MNPSQAQQYINSFINYEHKPSLIPRTAFKLDRMRRLLADLGNPQKGLKIIHVAGTKGKGSVCAMTASILKHAGYQVGLYTSPHINTYRERIRILSKTASGQGTEMFQDMLSEQEICALLEETGPAIERVRGDPKFERISFFEMYTALAFYYYCKKGTDFVVLETGMGGRLDATNVSESLIAVIMPVSLEHTHILGNTVGEIAKEKAGIIKSRSQKVILAPQTEEAEAVLTERCRQYGIKPLRVNDEHKLENVRIDAHRQHFDLVTMRGGYRQLSLRLMGVHQRQNASVAVATIEYLRDMGYIVSPAAIHEGLHNAFWPCRFEVMGAEPLTILDGAHNGDSARVLAQAVREVYKGRKVILVFGVSEDKNETLILQELEGLAAQVIFVRADHPRAKPLPNAVSISRALETARQRAGRDGIILVTGSIFVASEARRELSALMSGSYSVIHPA